MRVLVTGGAGFIGSHFVKVAHRELPDATICVLDALTYAGNRSTLAQWMRLPWFRFWKGRIQNARLVERVVKEERITHIVNFAAETHNDRSILDSGSFIQTDVFGVHVLLEAIRKFGLERMVQVSTDEVYGSIDTGEFTERSPIQPNTPYSASKAGGDLQVRAHVKAFGVPALVTRGGNTYGPYQYPEKLIPFFVTRLIDGKKVPLYGDGMQVREWIHAADHAGGILCALQRGEVGEVYNIGDSNERENREVVRILLEETGRDESFVKHIPDPRGGSHDARYSMDTEKIRALGWTPRRRFNRELRATVRWYLHNERWWRPITQRADYRDFIAHFYGPGLGDDL